MKVGGPELVAVLRAAEGSALMLVSDGQQVRLHPQGAETPELCIPAEGLQPWSEEFKSQELGTIADGVAQGRFQLALELKHGEFYDLTVEDLWIYAILQRYTPQRTPWRLSDKSQVEMVIQGENDYIRLYKLRHGWRFDYAKGPMRIYDTTVMGLQGYISISLVHQNGRWVWVDIDNNVLDIPDNDPVAWFRTLDWLVEIEEKDPMWTEAQPEDQYDRRYWLKKIYNRFAGPEHLTVVHDRGTVYLWEKEAQLAGAKSLPIAEASNVIFDWLRQGHTIVSRYDSDLTYKIKAI